jgi:hypothetical protein
LNENALATYGYSRIAFSTAGTGAAGQDWVISKTITYYDALSKAATGVWTDTGTNWVQTVKNLFLCTDSTATSDGDDDHLICSVALSAERTLLVADTLSCTLRITPSGS